MTDSVTNRQLVQELLKRTQLRKRPDGTDYQSLCLVDEKILAEESGFSRRIVQRAALENNIVPERYIRNQAGLSSRDQLKLLDAHVAIIGLGGLGGTVAEILARTGVGTLTLVDGDAFDESNLNRQLLSTEENLGKAKADVAVERISIVNPAVDCRARRAFLDRKNCRDLLKGADIAVDCLDSIPARFLLQEGCREHRIPMVSTAIGGKTGQLLVVPAGSNRLSQIYGPVKDTAATGLESKAGTQACMALFAGALECCEVVCLLVSGSPTLDDAMILADLEDYSMTRVLFPSTD